MKLAFEKYIQLEKLSKAVKSKVDASSIGVILKPFDRQREYSLIVSICETIAEKLDKHGKS